MHYAACVAATHRPLTFLATPVVIVTGVEAALWTTTSRENFHWNIQAIDREAGKIVRNIGMLSRPSVLTRHA
jgi:CDP-diacylglycerol pyrophosphatase